MALDGVDGFGDHLDEGFKQFFLREFEADQPEAVARLLASLGLPDKEYLTFLVGEGRATADRGLDPSSQRAARWIASRQPEGSRRGETEKGGLR